MKYAILALAAAQLLAAETFNVIHKKTEWWNGEGVVEVSDDGIAFTAKKEKNSRKWDWLDIQYFDRVSEREFVVLTYQDQKRYLGRDRSYRFLITNGELTDELFRRISEHLGRPVTNRVFVAPPDVRYELPVKHLHSRGGCEGTLRFTDDTVYYETDHKKDGREWKLARDVGSVWSAHPYHLELHVHDNNRREFSRMRVYKFDLKKPLDDGVYRALKLELYGVGASVASR